MRYFALLGLVMVVAVHAADMDWLYISSAEAPLPVPTAKAKEVREGMTLKQLTELCGPGWMKPKSGAGIIWWIFDDGRSLSVMPSSYTPEATITFNEVQAGSAGSAGWNR